MLTKQFSTKALAYLLVSAILTRLVVAQSNDSKRSAETPASVDARALLHVPNRPASPLFHGAQGKQTTEIDYTPSTHIVTMKLLVQDPNGYFIPNIRRDNFAVYEDGVRQHNASVEIEHAPVSVGLLVEHGGRYQTLHRVLADETARALRQFLDQVGRDDKVAIWKYGDNVEELASFSQGHENLESAIANLGTPVFSELNLYDALIDAVGMMKPLSGRRALILLSSGIDTFSKATYQEALRAVRDAGITVYVINLGPDLREKASMLSNTGLFVRLDWQRAEADLQAFAATSGGRVYSPRSAFDLSGIYDDVMENLRVRYVITYKSTGLGDATTARRVRVELVDATAGKPLQIVDTTGQPVTSTVVAEDTYVP